MKHGYLRKLHASLLACAILLGSAPEMSGQRDRHDSYYQGMRGRVRQDNYGGPHNDQRRRSRPDQGGGIGPGKGAIIGGVGGAVLGAIFGGGLKGTIIGGAAGSGMGALGAKLAQDESRNKRKTRRRR